MHLHLATPVALASPAAPSSTSNRLTPRQLAQVSELYGTTRPTGHLRTLIADYGSCKDADPSVFFPDVGQHDLAFTAKRVCAQCPVRLECLVVALRDHEEHGIWGGMTYKRRCAALGQVRASASPLPLRDAA